MLLDILMFAMLGIGFGLMALFVKWNDHQINQ